jgi:hypothetical protein
LTITLRRPGLVLVDALCISFPLLCGGFTY